MAEIHESVVQRKVRHEVRSPRAAAIAGIIYSILMYIIMLSTYNARIQPVAVTREWLQSLSGTASLVIALVPFAGMAFLWFTGVVRDQLSYQEGRFFATLFFGSGIIQVVLLFVWSAVFGAIMVTSSMDVVGSAGNGIYVFGYVLMNEIIGNYTLRMAGIYMTAIGALWGRTGLMPRWLIMITYILAVGFIFAANRFREARFIFPTWVLVVSVYILILNYRSKQGQEETDATLVDD
jgi:hypothetical protein